MSRAYLCVSIDTECDKGKGWLAKRPMAFAGVHDGVMKRLQPLFAKFGAKPTYLLSPEVLRDASCVEALETIEPSCELGTHLDGESAEREELTNVTDLFIRAFGQKPVSFRSGRYGIGHMSIPILESLGYEVESSVTPHIDFIDTPTQPYRPDPDAPGRPGDAKILEVPITIKKRVWNALPIVGRHIERRWLRPTRGTADALVRVAEDEIADARRAAPGRPVILNAMFHNVEVIPDGSPHAGDEESARGILERLGALLAFAERESIAVVGLGDVPEILGA